MIIDKASNLAHVCEKSSCSVLLVLLILGALQVSAVQADVAEIEPNNDSAMAQELDGSFNLEPNADVGDKTSNTSTSVEHVTVTGTGAGPTSPDIYKFSVTQAGKGVFEIDYGDIAFNPDRFGIATQLDGTIWIKDEKNFYFLDANMRPHFGFERIIHLRSTMFWL